MMNQADLFKKLGLILNELNEQYQYLAHNPQQLNELELDLFHANASFLADHAQIVKKINLNQKSSFVIESNVNEEKAEVINNQYPNEDIEEEELSIDKFEETVENESFEDEIIEFPDVAETLFDELSTKEETHLAEIEEEVFKLDNSPSSFEFILNDHSEHEKFEFERQSVDEVFNRPLTEPEERILAEKQKLGEEKVREVSEPEEDEIGPEPFLVHKSEEVEEEEEPIIQLDELHLEEAPVETIQINEATVVEDPTFKPTLNDMLAGKSTNNSNLNSTSLSGISDLKQGINLNDKLIYIKDLFNGYNLAYAEAIELANKMPNFETADSFFQKNYAVKNNWASKQTTVDKFYGLLNQRFK